MKAYKRRFFLHSNKADSEAGSAHVREARQDWEKKKAKRVLKADFDIAVNGSEYGVSLFYETGRKRCRVAAKDARRLAKELERFADEIDKRVA